MLAVILVLAGAAIVGLNDITGQGPGKGRTVACTDEALLCPDGKAVGREGAECRFSACSDEGPIDGMLVKNAAGYRLSTASPVPGMGGAYELPLAIASSTAEPLLGQQVTVSGTFTEGNTLSVASITPAAKEGAQEGILAVGQTKRIGGVTITLNSVVQDSRCPVDVECIEAGAITTNVTFATATDTETFNMPSDEVPRPFGAFQVSIVKIAPERVSRSETPQDAFRITFRVEPRAS